MLSSDFVSTFVDPIRKFVSNVGPTSADETPQQTTPEPMMTSSPAWYLNKWVWIGGAGALAAVAFVLIRSK